MKITIKILYRRRVCRYFVGTKYLISISNNFSGKEREMRDRIPTLVHVQRSTDCGAHLGDAPFIQPCRDIKGRKRPAGQPDRLARSSSFQVLRFVLSFSLACSPPKIGRDLNAFSGGDFSLPADIFGEWRRASLSCWWGLVLHRESILFRTRRVCGTEGLRGMM